MFFARHLGDSSTGGKGKSDFHLYECYLIELLAALDIAHGCGCCDWDGKDSDDDFADLEREFLHGSFDLQSYLSSKDIGVEY